MSLSDDDTTDLEKRHSNMRFESPLDPTKGGLAWLLYTCAALWGAV